MSTVAPARSAPVDPGLHTIGGTARTDALVRVLSGALLWLAMLLVTAWWVSDGGVRDLGSWASALTSTGRLTGLLGSVLLLAQVLLMARLPVLERAFGQDRLAAQHRLVGFTSLNLVLAHVGLITWGYAAGRLAGTPGTLWNLSVSYPGMLLAVAATACLLLVMVTSVRAARRRLRYESWHLLHLYAYLGVGLALPHQLWTGQQFTSSPWRTAFWWSAWAAAAGSILVWRVGRPLAINLRHQLRISDVVEEAPGVWSVHLTGRRLDLMDVEAGQFLTFRFLGRQGWSRGHPYSLSAAPDGRRLRLTVQAVGDGSARIRSLRPGTRVLVEGPYGRLGARARTRRKVAFLGAGVGTAPLRALADALPYAAGEAVYVERFTVHPLFANEVDTLAHRRGLHVHRLPGHRRADDSWLGREMHPAWHQLDDTTALRALVPDIAERDVFVCGPPAWTEAVTRALTGARVPAANIHCELFGW